jgi:hypothetical protein
MSNGNDDEFEGSKDALPAKGKSKKSATLKPTKVSKTAAPKGGDSGGESKVSGSKGAEGSGPKAGSKSSGGGKSAPKAKAEFENASKRKG